MTVPPKTFRGVAEFRSLAITGLFVLAVFYTLHLAQDLFLPIVLALLLAMLLRPVVRQLRRFRFPPAPAAALVMAALVTATGTALYGLWTPASEWVARAPQDLKQLETKIRRLLKPLERVTRTAAQVEQITDVGNTGAPAVTIKEPGLTETVFGGARHLLASALIVVVLAYFFLASGDEFLRKLPRALPRRHADRVLAVLQEAEEQVSRYLLAITLINLTLGLLTALAMQLLGMPTPLLLGAVAAALNFLPYLGPAIMAVLLAMIALLTFDDPGTTVLPPLLYIGLHALEANLVTPHLLGRRLPLNPTAIFIGFLLWWWIWGVPGALLAVPLLVTIKIVCDRTEALAGVGEFLGR